ncbi:MAG: sigma 54-interacting transcriptional regulator [Myxococcales bacterium]|nr:sigma 54-interacting transcriptional regulator [Myxococcales bacterium]
MVERISDEFSRAAEGSTDVVEAPEGLARRAALPRIGVVVHHGDNAEIVPLHEGARLTIGRVPEADITVPETTLSRQHARIELVGADVWIEDLGSRNGVLINGEPMRTRTVLRPGDDVAMGRVRLAVHTTASYARGFEHHAQFVSDLREELTRALTFGHSLALLLFAAADDSDSAERTTEWATRVRQTMRPVDRAGVQPGGVVELLLPECSADMARKRAEQLLAAEPALCCSLVVPALTSPPRGAQIDTSELADRLIARALALLARADRRERLIAEVSGPRGIVVPSDSAEAEFASDGGSDRRRRVVTPPMHGGVPVVESDSMKALYRTIERIARADRPVLVIGETGVGKEVIARAIHAASGRVAHPLRSVNCGAIHGELVQSALFGHERGSFTGASQRARGVFEQAHRGTLLLDEVGELPLSAQVALLRVLETGVVTRVGGGGEVPVDVRVIAATNRDLEAMCAAGTFRWDLFFRLETLTLRVPPLRQRVEEIIPLARCFADSAASAAGQAPRPLSAQLERVLSRYQWPGNVRELRNAVERAVLVASGDEIDVDSLPERVRAAALGGETTLRGPHGQPMSLRDPTPHLGLPAIESVDGEPPDGFKSSVRRFERDLIALALSQQAFNRRAAAEALRIPLRTLMNKIQEYALTPELVAGITAAVANADEPLAVESHKSFRQRVRELETELLCEALAAEDGNKAAAARRLALPLSTLHYKMRALGL